MEIVVAPFAPLIEALRRQAATLRVRLAPTLHGDLALLQSELHNDPLLDAGGVVEVQTLAALSAACLTLTPSGATLDPLVVLIDDLQWVLASCWGKVLSC